MEISFPVTSLCSVFALLGMNHTIIKLSSFFNEL